MNVSHWESIGVRRSSIVKKVLCHKHLSILCDTQDCFETCFQVEPNFQVTLTPMYKRMSLNLCVFPQSIPKMASPI